MRNGSGVYVAPAGNPVVTNTVIQSSWANTLVTDLGNELTNSLPRDGQAPMLAPLKVVDGTQTAPGLTFNSDTNTGLFRPGSGSVALSVGGSEQLRVVSGSVLLGQTSSTGERLQLTGDLKVTGNTALSGTLTVGGSSVVVANSSPTLAALTVTGAATVGTTFGVTGATTLTGTLTPNSTVAYGANYTELQNSITATSTTTVNCSLGNIFTVAMNASITTLTISNVPASGRVFTLTLFLKQDGTGSRTVSWPGAIKWPGGTTPTLTTTANKTDVVTLTTFDAGTTWYGFSTLNF